MSEQRPKYCPLHKLKYWRACYICAYRDNLAEKYARAYERKLRDRR